MNKDKVYLQGYVVGFNLDTVGYNGLRIQLPNMDIVEIDESLVYRNIDEPQKPVVPQFVADWIKYCKGTGVNLQRALNMEDLDFYNYANQKDDLKLKDFFEVEGNQDLFARAWLDGFEIEKEKRYLVKVKGMSKFYEYLNFDTMEGRWKFFDCENTDKYRTHHTRKELEETGFGWVFDCEGIELEEV